MDCLLLPFIEAKNEVQILGERMKGLTIVKHKVDVMKWLPDKIYRIVECQPDVATKRAANFIKRTAPRAINALIQLRELSDGFQYAEAESEDYIKCPACEGVGKLRVPKEDVEVVLTDDDLELVPCDKCKGKGLAKKMIRTTKNVNSPKEKALKDLLDEFEDYARIVIYAGFQGAVDKCIETVVKAGWEYIKVDGRGWANSLGIEDDQEMISKFQSEDERCIAFIGQPGAGGMGLTLTKSPVMVFYSNDFNFESRAQAEDRIHRAGMDTNKGATIIDLVNLETDRLIIDNLKAKRSLQSLSMKELR